MLAALAACGDAPDATSGPATGTSVTPQPTVPATSATTTTTTTSPVTVTHTSLAATTTTPAPAVDDPGDLYALDVASGEINRLTTDHSIDLIDTDGTNRTTLAQGAANRPSWSPDGGRIAAVTVVTDDDANDFYPAWSPDDDTIVFTRASSVE
jgi:hypothetical protein